jgi:hypothetical protein
MGSRLFICPATRMNVQHWVDDDADVPETEYKAVKCKACSGMHLVNRKTGKLLGQKEDE